MRIVALLVTVVVVLPGIGCSRWDCPGEQSALALQITDAREHYFRNATDPVRRYKWDGVKGVILDVWTHPGPSDRYQLISYGESYCNTTGHSKHFDLQLASNPPSYPGNVHFNPMRNCAFEWLGESELAVYYVEGYYPDDRDSQTGTWQKRADFEYENVVEGVRIKFMGLPRPEFDKKEDAMEEKRIKMSEKDGDRDKTSPRGEALPPHRTDRVHGE